MIHKTCSQIFTIPNFKLLIHKLKEFFLTRSAIFFLNLCRSLDLTSSYNTVGHRAQNLFTDF